MDTRVKSGIQGNNYVIKQELDMFKTRTFKKVQQF